MNEPPRKIVLQFHDTGALHEYVKPCPYCKLGKRGYLYVLEGKGDASKGSGGKP